MKYTILINQAAVAEAGLHKTTDLVDWAILEYIHSWQTNPEATRINGYVSLNYKRLIQEMPLLGLRTKQSVSGRIGKLRSLNLLESIRQEGAGGSLYVRTTPLFFDILLRGV